MNPAGGEQGFALLIVAIGIAMLSLILGAALELGQQQADATDALVRRTQLSAALAGALATFEEQLVTGNHVQFSKILRPQVVLIGSIVVAVSAQPEFGRVDLNSADPNLLSALFDAAGADHGTTKAIIAAILSRRGDDNSATLTSQEDRPEPFASVRELRALPNMTDRVYECLSSDLTVFSGLSRPIVRSASVRIRRAMATLGPSYSNAHDSVSERPVAAGDILRVTLSAKDAGGALDSESIIIRVTGGRSQPFWVLARDIQTRLTAERGCGIPDGSPHKLTAWRS